MRTSDILSPVAPENRSGDHSLPHNINQFLPKIFVKDRTGVVTSRRRSRSHARVSIKTLFRRIPKSNVSRPNPDASPGVVTHPHVIASDTAISAESQLFSLPSPSRASEKSNRSLPLCAAVASSMISAPPVYAMRHTKIHDLDSLNDFDFCSEPLRDCQAESGSAKENCKIESFEAGSLSEETRSSMAPMPKWPPVHPLSLETYTSIATSPGPLCDVRSTDSVQPLSAVSADDLLPSPARRLHRFLATPKIMRLEQLKGDPSYLQPVEEQSARDNRFVEDGDDKREKPPIPKNNPVPQIKRGGTPPCSSHRSSCSRTPKSTSRRSANSNRRAQCRGRGNDRDRPRGREILKDSPAESLQKDEDRPPAGDTQKPCVLPVPSPRARCVPKSPALRLDSSHSSSRTPPPSPRTLTESQPRETDLEQSPSVSSFPPPSPFLHWMVKASESAAHPNSESLPVSSPTSDSTQPAETSEIPQTCASPVVKEKETACPEIQQPPSLSLGPSPASDSLQHRSSLKSSTHFETANEDFISAQETQGDRDGVSLANDLPVVQEMKQRGGTDNTSSSSERRRHKSPVQRIMSALTRRLFTGPLPTRAKVAPSFETEKESTPLTEKWSASKSADSVCKERNERRKRMQDVVAKVLEDSRSLKDDTESSSFGLKDTCNELKLRCFPKILTPVRASTCATAPRLVSQQSRFRHISTFSQPTPPSSRMFQAPEEYPSPPSCVCHLGQPSEVSSSFTSGLRFALPQPRTASSVGASSWKRCINGPIILPRGSSRPASSASSYQSSDSSFALLSPPKGGMRTLVGVFSAVEDAALKKYYDCLEDLRRRGDPLASTLSSDVGGYDEHCARCVFASSRPYGKQDAWIQTQQAYLVSENADRSTAEACMEVCENASSHSSDFSDTEIELDDDSAMEASLNLRVSVPAHCAFKREGACGLHGSRSWRQTLMAVKSAPPRSALSEEEAEKRLRRFLAHVVMKRRLKRIKLLQDSATKIQRWFRAHRLRDETSSPLPPPKHRILPDGRILNVPRVIYETAAREVGGKPAKWRLCGRLPPRGFSAGCAPRASTRVPKAGVASSFQDPHFRSCHWQPHIESSASSDEQETWEAAGSEVESCLWRRERSFQEQDRDIAVRVYPRPPVKVTMNRNVSRRF
eukprot:Gregarina_sp_Poly_1__4359@NODE_235_length_10966_cov_193_557758_g208_i0_p1_GENE_NODE_235_length_10966_cov_193_557758_g208_i0NODE_235_length_10966_cov_193_557758_g208_i0_p1_ORF_typecomplete_len1152_score202_99IQ/PF00612_27/0_0077_NODE_235_length_10966_cov_193_557758_g208_i029926447